MRRKDGAFEAVITAPTLGLITRIPGNQIDPRTATVASNMRFDQGVARNAEGYGLLTTKPPLETQPSLIFQGELAPKNNQRQIPAIFATEQRLWSVLRWPVGYAPPTIVGIIDVTDTAFKSAVNALGGAVFYVRAYAGSSSVDTFFTWDSGLNHFRVEDSSIAVASDLLDVTALVQGLAGSIVYVAFYIQAGSSNYFFHTGGPMALEVSALPVPAMVNSTLVEAYSGGPQEVTIQDNTIFQFHIKARSLGGS